jgi:hypothetical protein
VHISAVIRSVGERWVSTGEREISPAVRLGSPLMEFCEEAAFAALGYPHSIHAASASHPIDWKIHVLEK